MNFSDIIKQSIINNFTTDMPISKIVIVMAMSLIMGLYIFGVYRVAINNEFYSKDFNKVLSLMTITTAAIVLAIQSNLVISLGMVGALSIVRFRTAVKSPLDLFFLFWAISVGIICGAQLYILAIVLSVAITIMVFILDGLKIPATLELLVINCDDLDTYYETINGLKGLSDFLREKNRTISKEYIEAVLEIKSKDMKSIENYLNEINGIHSFAIMNFDRETRI